MYSQDYIYVPWFANFDTSHFVSLELAGKTRNYFESNYLGTFTYVLYRPPCHPFTPPSPVDRAEFVRIQHCPDQGRDLCC
jgi:hypothetical protein